MDYMDTYKFWCENDYFDAKTKEELLAIKNDEKEIKERFSKHIITLQHY